MNSRLGSLVMFILSIGLLCFGIYTIRKASKQRKEEKSKNQ
ncbi:MAG: hypothetical protein RR565_05055 [Erysipelothrix sp.]